MSESPETTATFKNLLNSGLVTKKDLVSEGFHEAATAVMVDNPPNTTHEHTAVASRRPVRNSGGKDLCETDAAKPARVTGTSRARENDDNNDEEETKRGGSRKSPSLLDGVRGDEVVECASSAAAAVTAGFSHLADEIGKMFISDQQQHRQRTTARGGYDAEEEEDSEDVGDSTTIGANLGEAEEARFAGLRAAGRTDEDPASPILTEATIFKTMCGPLLGIGATTESPKQVRAEFGVAEEPVGFVEYRDPPSTMM